MNQVPIQRTLLRVVAVLLLLCGAGEKALSQTLSSQARAHILICSPGGEVYSAFGHCAVRIEDPNNRLDRVYNYGTFNFSDPDFIMKFTRGQLEYFLSISNYKSFIRAYTYEGRSVLQQSLALDDAQVQELFNLLEKNYLPDNRYYKYDFFFDNCSSRIRDILQSALGDRLTYKSYPGVEGKTFRELFRPYLKDEPWLEFGIDLLLGLPADQIAGHQGAVYIPDFLKLGMDAAVLDGKPLVGETSTVLDLPAIQKSVGFFSPTLVCWLVFAVIFGLFFYEQIKNLNFIWLDRVLYFLVGLLGCFMLFMWLGTDHDATQWNLNVLWAVPSHLIMVFFLRKDNKNWVHRYFIFTALLLPVLLLLSWPIFPQDFAAAVFPLILALIVRGFKIATQ